MSKGLFDIFNKGVQKEKKYVDKVLKPQIMDRKAYGQVMRGGVNGKVSPGISQRAANFVAAGKPPIKWR